MTLACGLYDRMLALQTGDIKHRPEFSGHRQSTRDFRPDVEPPGIRRLRNVELGICQPARPEEIALRSAARFRLAGLSPRLHRRQSQVRRLG